jgi:hypothetical protein
MNSFIHVAFDTRGKGEKFEKFKKKFNLAKDWIYYAPNCWILYTRRSADAWFDIIKPLLGEDDRVFIVEISRDASKRSGFLQPDVWEWLDRERE